MSAILFGFQWVNPGDAQTFQIFNSGHILISDKYTDPFDHVRDCGQP